MHVIGAAVDAPPLPRPLTLEHATPAAMEAVGDHGKHLLFLDFRLLFGFPKLLNDVLPLFHVVVPAMGALLGGRSGCQAPAKGILRPESELRRVREVSLLRRDSAPG